MTLTYDLDWKKTSVKDVSGHDSKMKTFELAAAYTDTTAVRGDALSTYELYPVAWAKALVDAAKARMMYLGLLDEVSLTPPNNTYIVSKRQYYLPQSGTGGWSTDSGELAVNTNVTWTAVNTPTGVQIVPQNYMFGAEITNKAIRTNVLDIVKYTREEVLYHQLDYVDTLSQAVFTGAATQTQDTAMSDGYKMQTILGGTANLTSTLATGDTLSPDMVAKARRLLMTDGAHYWSSGTTFTRSTTAKKNPWLPEPAKPFVMVIAPEQEEALQTDSQFTNAAEYGGNEVVMNGEIGKYLGVKVISTVKTPSFVSGTTYSIEGSTRTFSVAGHRCFMTKAKTCGTAVWGQKPKLYVFDWPSGMKKRVALEFAFGVGTVFDDAIVEMFVSDQ